MSRLIVPPERDLPDHAAVRRHVVRAASARPRRPGWLLPAATAAGVTLVTAAVAVGTGWLDVPGAGTAVPPGSGAPTDRLLAACLGPPALDPTAPRLPTDPRGSRVLLRFTDAAGSMVVVGRPGATGGVATCDLDRAGQVGGGPVRSSLRPWAPGFDPARRPIVLDLAESRIAVVGAATYTPGAPGVYVVVGRVGPAVTRVVATWRDGYRAVAVVRDGLYAARHVVPGAGNPLPLLSVTVQAYDARGHLLDTARGGGPEPAAPPR